MKGSQLSIASMYPFGGPLQNQHLIQSGLYRFFFSLRNVHSRPKNRQFSQVCECGDNKHLFLLLKPNNQSSIPVVQKVQLSQALKTLVSGFGLPASPDPSGAILISPTDQAVVETILTV